MQRLGASACIFGKCGKLCGVEFEGLVEGDEVGEVARTQPLMGLECHNENCELYAENTGLPWKGFEQRRDKFGVEY